MFNILLNITQKELTHVNGDITYLNALKRSRHKDLNFHILKKDRSNYRSRVFSRIYKQKYLPELLRNTSLINSKLVKLQLEDDLKSSYDLIHTHLIYPIISQQKKQIATVWSSQGIIPEWYEFHGRNDYKEVLNLYSIFEKKTDALISWTKCGAEGIASIPGVDNSKIFVIPPFVEIEYKKTKNKEGLFNRILFIGRDAKRKGLLDLLEAFNIIEKKLPGIKLDVVGINKESIKMNFNLSNVVFHGILPRNKINELFSTCALFVLPTNAETFGLVFLEAMADQVPVVAYDIRPINEIVENGKQGILVEKNNIGALVNAIYELITNVELRKRIQMSQKLRMEKIYSKDSVLRQLTEVYNYAIERFKTENEILR